MTFPAPLAHDARMTARYLANLPVMYAVAHRQQVELIQHPDILWLAIWTGSATVHGAVRDSWSAGLRNQHLRGPEDWRPGTVH